MKIKSLIGKIFINKYFRKHQRKILIVLSISILYPLFLSAYENHQQKVFYASGKFYQNKHSSIPFTGHSKERSFLDKASHLRSELN